MSLTFLTLSKRSKIIFEISSVLVQLKHYKVLDNLFLHFSAKAFECSAEIHHPSKCFFRILTDNFWKQKNDWNFFYLEQKIEPEWELVLRENPKISSNLAAVSEM